ncbi:GNAT family N-acetyltransferase [Parahaliea aestuarii]|uniref:GNAT family N-acetyltransferase n=1 Tax=Parahaliea aestuarii TaxID=1852021 RepID=A0A5C8ZXJ3_9GAMM|nr:GNAT family N-acetyltransferase [Parahaliea aestuarii]TXS93245.1 GNAT family N-acetyltransferase [Parahaliea aestuarii]
MSNEPDAITLQVVSWNEASNALGSLRRTVFIEEQGVPRDVEWDGRDAECRHVLALRGDQPVGCGRLMPDGKIGRMAVLASERGRGVGAAVLQRLVELARECGFERVYVHAQQHAAPFYSRAGFVPRGATFEEAGIPHTTMHLALTTPA